MSQGPSSQELNGLIGTLVGWVEEKRRFSIALRVGDTGEMLPPRGANSAGGKIRQLAIRGDSLMALGPLYCDWEWGEATPWVAKENKRVENDLSREVEFHEKALITQATAAAMATDFNEEVSELHLPNPVPRACYLEPTLFVQVRYTYIFIYTYVYIYIYIYIG